MREHPRFPFLDWLKDRSGRARVSFANSGIPAPDLAALGIDLGALRLELDDAHGWAPLVRAVARAYGAGEDEVLVTPSCTYANYVAIRTLFGPGDRVLIEQPTYELLACQIVQAGAQPVPIDRGLFRSFALDFDAIERELDRGAAGVVLTSPHNPSGATFDREERARLAQIAREHAVPVVIDEIYLDAHLDAGFRSHFVGGQGIVATGSLTKAYGLGSLRVGWVLAAPERIDEMRVLDEQIADRVASWSAQAAERVLCEPRRAEVRATAAALRARNLPLVRELVARSSRLELHDPGFGLSVLLVVDRGEHDTRALGEDLLARDGVLVVPGEMFGAPGVLRLSLGGATEQVREGLAALERRLATRS